MISYSDFYEKLLLFAEQNPGTVIGKELRWIKRKINKVINGESWGTVLRRFSNATWPVEEASYLRIGEKLDKFFEEIKDFINRFKAENIDDVILYQKSIIVKWENSGSISLETNIPIHSFYAAHLIGGYVELKSSKYIIKITDNLNFNGDRRRYAKEVVWWGRKGGKFIYQNITENETK